MSETRTFSGKNLDEAMEQACRHFKVEREKLEIEIITGGSTGIFGLVGKKKAEIRARLREEVRLTSESVAPLQSKTPAGSRPKPQSGAAPVPAASAQGAEPVAAVQDSSAPVGVSGAAAEAPAGDCHRSLPTRRKSAPPLRPRLRPMAPAPGGRSGEQRRKPASPRRAHQRRASPPRKGRLARAAAPPAELSEELSAIIRDIMENLLKGILEEVPKMEISGNAERVTVLVLDEENSGLLIGREGQTLSSLQYLVNRIVSRRCEQPVRVQINTGEYRERQDDNLRKMAVYLADKAKSLGRPQSTKPLSSYHRRVVHLALQEDETIQTRSKGDGPLKRVIIVPKAQRTDNQADRAK
jgi:spoIIIJ-associated protein